MRGVHATSSSTVSPALGSWPPRSCVLRILSRQSSVPISVGGIGRIPDCQFWSMPELAQVTQVPSIAEHAQEVAAADAGDHDIEALHVQVGRERSGSDAHGQEVQSLPLDVEVRQSEC